MATPEKVEQAGALAFRREGEVTEVLIVRGRKNPENWIFPKGHVEAGESAAACAIRELREEGGVAGQMVEPVGTLEFESGDESVRVDYFVVRFVEEVAKTDKDREARWCPWQEAIVLLSFPDARALLMDALPIVEAKLD